MSGRGTDGRRVGSRPPRREAVPSPFDPMGSGVESGSGLADADGDAAKRADQGLAGFAAVLARRVEGAVSPASLVSRRRVRGDFFGLGSVAAVFRSAKSTMTLAVILLMLLGVLRLVAFIGGGVILAAVWGVIGYVLVRNRARIDWSRLGMLVRRPKPPAD